MTAVSEIAEIAFERAWRVYRLINSKLDESSTRRAELKQFIRKCCEHGATDAEAIVVLALIHLKQLNGLATYGGLGAARLQPGKSGTNAPASG